jgi:hypothetical protein
MKKISNLHFFKPYTLSMKMVKNNPAVSTPAGIDVYPEGGHLIKVLKDYNI